MAQGTAVLSSPLASGHKSVWVTLLIFIVIAHFNPEILTNSTSAQEYLTLRNFLNMLFYGLQVAIIADLGARYRLKWSSLFLIGLVYGILEEGFAAMTMEMPSIRLFLGMDRVYGINVTWSIFISIVHAVLTVVGTLLIVRVIWPERVKESFLSAKHYVVIIPVVALLYALSIQSRLLIYAPDPIIFAILGGIVVVLILGVRLNQSRPQRVSAKPKSVGLYLVVFLLAVLLSVLAPISLSSSNAGSWVVNVVLLSSGGLFMWLFTLFDTDTDLGTYKMMLAFSIVIGFWLLVGTRTRTPASNILAYVGVGAQLLFGWRKAGRKARLEGNQTKNDALQNEVLSGDSH